MKRNILFALFAILFISSCIKDRVTATGGGGGTVTPPVNTNGETLIYYWNFNTDSADALTPTLALISGASLVYNGAYYDTCQPGTTLNAIGSDTVLVDTIDASLRLRNPASGPFIMTLPTTGYDSIVVKYAEERTSKGSATNYISYTTDGSTWKTTAISSYASISIDSTDASTNAFQLVSLNFTSDTTVNNNPNFKVRVLFSDSLSTNTSGNDRIDNITVYGVPK